MEILINGTPHIVPEQTTAAELLVILELQAKRLAFGSESRISAAVNL